MPRCTLPLLRRDPPNMLRRALRLIQLPIPQPARGASTGNVPLAAACLAAAVSAARPPTRARPDFAVELVPPSVTDRLGDTLLAAQLAADEPACVGFSLYLWNSERSLHVARELKRRSPRTQVVIGGPEVDPSNLALLAQDGWDVAVSGEAEEILPEVLAHLARDASREGQRRTDDPELPGVAFRPRSGDPIRFGSARPASFSLSGHPSPYLLGILPVDPRRATYVETVRGCRSRCTFCSYPRSSPVLRSLDVRECRELLAELAQRGAREVVFLDPTFNHRPDFEELLRAMVAQNASGPLRFFAEVRAEGLTEEHADLLAAAGFHKLEIGLQSVNPRALAKSRRGGRPQLVAEAARMLKARGIDLLVDLIVGLPEDGADDVRAGVRFLAEEGLAEHAQVFPLSILPGTRMREEARADGIEYETTPPYRVLRTRTLGESAIGDLLLEAEEILGRRLDESPRPGLAAESPDAGVPAVFTIDVDRDPRDDHDAARPGAQHTSLWIHGRDLWAARQRIVRAIEARTNTDPHATLDVVLCAGSAFPLDLVDVLGAALDRAPRSYAARATAHRGEDGQHRLCAVVRADADWPRDHQEALDRRIPVFRERSAADASSEAEALGDTELGVRIVGAVPERDFAELARRADPESVTFADPALEQRWVDEVLGYGESP